MWVTSDNKDTGSKIQNSDSRVLRRTKCTDFMKFLWRSALVRNAGIRLDYLFYSSPSSSSSSRVRRWREAIVSRSTKKNSTFDLFIYFYSLSLSIQLNIYSHFLCFLRFCFARCTRGLQKCHTASETSSLVQSTEQKECGKTEYMLD